MQLNAESYEIIIGTILGIIQGLTEFLPVSSSGHLTLAIALFDVKFPLSFEILLHIATLLAVLIYTYPILVHLVISNIHILRSKLNPTQEKNHPTEDAFKYFKLLIALIISTLITAMIGFSIKDIVENASTQLVGSLLLVTGLVLILPFISSSKRSKIISKAQLSASEQIHNNEIFTQHSWKYVVVFSVILGVVQGGSVFPGISRAGVTITTSVLLGLGYSQSIKYSFLMSIPAILASFVFSLPELPELMESISYTALAISMIFAFLTALIGMRCLNLIAIKGKIWMFSLYLLIAGSIALFI